MPMERRVSAQVGSENDTFGESQITSDLDLMNVGRKDINRKQFRM